MIIQYFGLLLNAIGRGAVCVGWARASFGREGLGIFANLAEASRFAKYEVRKSARTASLRQPRESEPRRTATQRERGPAERQPRGARNPAHNETSAPAGAEVLNFYSISTISSASAGQAITQAGFMPYSRRTMQPLHFSILPSRKDGAPTGQAMEQLWQPMQFVLS